MARNAYGEHRWLSGSHQYHEKVNDKGVNDIAMQVSIWVSPSLFPLRTGELGMDSGFLFECGKTNIHPISPNQKILNLTHDTYKENNMTFK